MAEKKSANVKTEKYESKRLLDCSWRRKDEGKDKERVSSTR